jgi:hypothetical protein
MQSGGALKPDSRQMLEERMNRRAVRTGWPDLCRPDANHLVESALLTSLS